MVPAGAKLKGDGGLVEEKSPPKGVAGEDRAAKTPRRARAEAYATVTP